MVEVAGIEADCLRSFIERIERLNDEEDGIKADKREIFAQAKAAGFVPKTMRQVVAARKIDPDRRIEDEHLFDIYMRALDDGTHARDAREADPRSPACQLASDTAGQVGQGPADSGTGPAVAGSGTTEEFTPESKAADTAVADQGPCESSAASSGQAEGAVSAASVADGVRDGEAAPEALVAPSLIMLKIGAGTSVSTVATPKAVAEAEALNPGTITGALARLQEDWDRMSAVAMTSDAERYNWQKRLLLDARALSEKDEKEPRPAATSPTGDGRDRDDSGTTAAASDKSPSKGPTGQISEGGVAQLGARRTHYPEVASSNLAPATNTPSEAASPSDLEIPSWMRRGHPDCVIGSTKACQS